MKYYDPRMHTAEHILNAVMDYMFACGRSISSHIEKKKSKCDYNLKRTLTRPEIKAVADTVNSIIRSGIDVREEFITMEEAIKEFFRNELPGHIKGNVRIIKIGNFDTCPCIGGHVSNTAEIGEFIITSIDHENDRLRLRFRLK